MTDSEQARAACARNCMPAESPVSECECSYCEGAHHGVQTTIDFWTGLVVAVAIEAAVLSLVLAVVQLS